MGTAKLGTWVSFGSASTSNGQPCGLPIDGYSTYIPSMSNASSIVGIENSGTLVTSNSGATQYFMMRGYYVSGATYETWISTGTPNTTPPSGHTLTNITITATWII